ncbi:MAG: helix-turn-helix domain-containing protein [Bradymonadaceae bacterium]
MAKYNAQEVIDALREAKGTVTKAAKILECHRSTVYRYIDDYATVKREHERWNQKLVDDARRSMHELLEQAMELATGENPDVHAIREARQLAMSILKTKGKDRGWSERQEITGKDGQPFTGKTTEAIAAKIEDHVEALEEEQKDRELDEFEAMDDQLEPDIGDGDG